MGNGREQNRKSARGKKVTPGESPEVVAAREERDRMDAVVRSESAACAGRAEAVRTLIEAGYVPGPAVLSDIETDADKARAMFRAAWQARFNADIAESEAKHAAEDDPWVGLYADLGVDDYEVKKKVVKSIGSRLREKGFAVAHPDTSEPCVLVAVATEDKLGRYVLESRETGKRSKSSKSLAELMPFTLCDDSPKKVSTGRPPGQGETAGSNKAGAEVEPVELLRALASRTVLTKTKQDYEAKRRFAKRVSNFLVYRSLGIKRPRGTEACVLKAVPSQDGAGRFVLEGRHSKTCTDSCSDIMDIFGSMELVRHDALK